MVIWGLTTQITRRETCCRFYMDYSFRLAASDLFDAPSHKDRTAYTTAFVIPVVEHWLEPEIAILLC